MTKIKFQRLPDNDIKTFCKLISTMTEQTKKIQDQKKGNGGELTDSEQSSHFGYTCIIKSILDYTGLENYLVLTEIFEKEYYVKEKGLTMVNGYFELTVQELEESIGFNDYKQRKCLNNLKSLGLIDFKQMKYHGIRFIRINHNANSNAEPQDENITTIQENYLKDKRLSLKAIGLLSTMLSLPDGSVFSIDGLCKTRKEQKTSITSALNELKKYGYVIVTKMNPCKENGGKYEYVYNAYENAQLKEDK